MATVIAEGLIASLLKKITAESLFEAFAKGFASQVGKEAAKAIINSLTENEDSPNIVLTQEEKAEIELLAPYMSTSKWNKLIANFKIFHRNNVLLLGPTGVGKTQLYKFLTGDNGDSREATRSTAKKQVMGHRQYLHYIDTPGSRTHADIEEYAFKQSVTGGKTVVAIVLAGGRLENATLGGYYLPGVAQRKRFDTLSDYIVAGLEYERRYLSDLNAWLEENQPAEKNVTYYMILLNKMDIWLDNYQHTLDYYQGKLKADKAASCLSGVAVKYTKSHSNEINKLILSIGDRLCKVGTHPTFHVVASTYDTFPRRSKKTIDQKEAPSAKLSQDLTSISKMLVQAEFRKRIHIG